MKYFYSILIIGLLLVIWFAPIDLERERSLAGNGFKTIILYILEHTWLKVVVSLFFVFMLVGIHSKDEA
jgi:hypothetical protein